MRCKTAFVCCFLRKWKIVYWFLYINRCRRRTWSGQLQWVNKELLFVEIQFLRLLYDYWYLHSFSDKSCAINLVFYCEPFSRVRRGFHRELAHTVNSLQIFFWTFSNFDVVWCCFCGFLMCNEDWLSSIAIIMTAHFLFWTQGYIGILMELFFCKSCHWNCFLVAVNWILRCSLTSCFSISFWNFFCTVVMQKLYLVRCKTACFLFQSKKANNCLSTAPDTDADEEHGLAHCNVRIRSSSLCWDSVFPRYLRLVLIAQGPLQFADLEHSCL